MGTSREGLGEKMTFVFAYTRDQVSGLSMLQISGSQLGSHPFSFLLKQPGPLPARQVLTTGPHPGRGLSQRGPAAPVLKGVGVTRYFLCLSGSRSRSSVGLLGGVAADEPLSTVRCDPVDRGPPGSSVRGISKARVQRGLPLPSPSWAVTSSASVLRCPRAPPPIRDHEAVPLNSSHRCPALSPSPAGRALST